MTDEELQDVVESIGFEQIMFDAQLTVIDVAIILQELGYIYLEKYEEEI